MMQIDITGVNVVELVKKAYDLSRPQGMGFLHFQEGSMTDEEAKSLIAENGTVNLDYISGRACKFGVYKEDGRMFINAPWYDHSDQQLVDLLAHVGITYNPGSDEHGCACNCDGCRVKQGKDALGPKGGFQ